MPIYEYLCGKCESEFEVEQRITDDPVKTCPQCRSRKVKRLISQTSFVLKGSGWYSDLYASSSGKDEKKDGADASADKSTKDAKGGKDAKSSKSGAKSEKKSKSGGKGAKKGGKAAA
ncbi:MAG: zinc ribbon domain-containing protein [Myxococcota bacterium]|nr:zinc ribbon domain-containing protein [Myxococcota bacterium]